MHARRELPPAAFPATPGIPFPVRGMGRAPPKGEHGGDFFFSGLTQNSRFGSDASLNREIRSEIPVSARVTRPSVIS